MIRIIIILGLIALAVLFSKKIMNMFHDPKRCSKCGGRGYWRGTRPDEKERCDECFGTGKTDYGKF